MTPDFTVLFAAGNLFMLEFDPVKMLLFVAKVFAITFVSLLLFTSYMRFFYLSQQARAADRILAGSQFAYKISRHIKLFSRSTPFIVCLAKHHHYEAFKEKHGATTATSMMEHLAAFFRDHLRDGDEVYLIDDNRIGLIIHAECAHIEPILVRLKNKLDFHSFKDGHGTSLPHHIYLGAGAYPADAEGAESLLDFIEVSMEKAESEGVDQWVYNSSKSGTEASTSTDEKKTPGGSKEYENVYMQSQKLLADARSEAIPSCFLAIQIDDIAKYEKMYGEQTAAQIAQEAESVLRKTMRAEDFLGPSERGQFYAVIESDSAGAQVLAQRMLRALKKTSFTGGGVYLKIAAGIGIAGLPEHAVRPRDVIECGREALRAASDRGLNTYVVFDPEWALSKRDQSEPVDVF